MRHNYLARWMVGTSGGAWAISRRGAERQRAQRGLAVDLAACAPHGNVNEGNLHCCFRYRESRSLGENLKDTILQNSKTRFFKEFNSMSLSNMNSERLGSRYRSAASRPSTTVYVQR